MVASNTNKIRRGRKFDQVLEGARLLFLRDGYEAVSVDMIAQQAGVSKATLYSYFADKRLLFLEASRCECDRQADEARHLLSPETPVPEMLEIIGHRIISFISSDFGQAMFRIGVAESTRFPEIGRQFYQAGPMLLRGRLGEYLREIVERGDLVIDDCDLAADQFAALCCADVQDRILYGVDKTIPTADAKRVVDSAVLMFLARYGRQSGINA